MLVRDRSQQPRIRRIDCVASSHTPGKPYCPALLLCPLMLRTPVQITDRRVLSSLSTHFSWQNLPAVHRRILEQDHRERRAHHPSESSERRSASQTQVPTYRSPETNRVASEEILRGALCCAMWVLALRGADYAQYWRYRRNE